MYKEGSKKKIIYGVIGHLEAGERKGFVNGDYGMPISIIRAYISQIAMDHDIRFKTSTIAGCLVVTCIQDVNGRVMSPEFSS